MRHTIAAVLFVCALPAPSGAGAASVPPLRPTASPVSGGVHRSAPALNVYQRRALESLLAGASLAVGDTLRVAAFQVQFSDSLMGGQPGSNRPEPRDSTWFGNELRHTADYFRGASRGRMETASALDGTLYTLPKPMGYYGRDEYEDVRVVELAQTVIDSADDHIDFSRYDHVFIIHAGAGQETDIAGNSRGQIWSSFYDRDDIEAAMPDSVIGGLVTRDSLGGEPFFVDNFSIVPSDASQDFFAVGTLGIWVFQIASRVGLVPLFDSSPPIPDSQGVGGFDLMSYGLYNVNGFVPGFPCAFNRVLAGWLDPVTVPAEASPAFVRLADVNTGADTDTLCVKVAITEDEYFLVVNRVHDADFDSLFTFGDLDSNLVPENTDSLDGAEFDFFLTDLTNPAVRSYDPAYGFDVTRRHTGSGVYVWHVDERVVRDALALGGLPNDYAARKGVDLEEADGVQDLDRGGPAAFALGSHFDSYRSGDGNQSAFTPATEPASDSNAHVPSGVAIEDISAIGSVMSLTIRRALPYQETRTRFAARASGQPATPVDLDGDATSEIVVFADTGLVYLFDETGAEYDDVDADPSTIAPYIVAPGAVWTGPPAFGNLDGGADVEIIASDRAGRLYAWKADGSELADGDGNPLTEGVLFAGAPLAAPQMLVDLLDDGFPEIALVEVVGDSLRVGFVDSAGAPFVPGDPAFAPLWPARVPGQLAAPLALAGTANGATPAKMGVVVASVDTTTAQVHVTYTPALYSAGTSFVGQAVAKTWHYAFAVPPSYASADYLPSAPAAGDVDADGHDEVVLTFPDGLVAIFENEAGETGSVSPTLVRMRADRPSAPALGDVDDDGTLEIALWDRDYLYVLKSNGRVATEWPRLIVPESAGEQPPRALARGLESPALADLDGDGRVDVLFALEDGTLQAARADGTAAPGFPRVGVAGVSATPSIAPLVAGGALRLVGAGTVPALRGVDTVVDTVATLDQVALLVQSLTGGSSSRVFWPIYGGGLERHGRSAPAGAPATSSRAFREETFMVYPNPVRGATVHARVTLDASARVEVQIYNLEGERTHGRAYDANAAGAIDTPFDEEIDVSALRSGVYFMRLRIESSGASGSLVKTFAIRR